jgi:hypothetical protein
MDRNWVIHGHVAKEFCGAAIATVAGEIELANLRRAPQPLRNGSDGALLRN